jgi:hypothetical protein
MHRQQGQRRMQHVFNLRQPPLSCLVITLSNAMHAASWRLSNQAGPAHQRPSSKGTLMWQMCDSPCHSVRQLRVRPLPGP